eukprot:scaffold48634_cov57-Phaeocystis_antarctica.AAC.1
MVGVATVRTPLVPADEYLRLDVPMYLDGVRVRVGLRVRLRLRLRGRSQCTSKALPVESMQAVKSRSLKILGIE